MPKPRVLVICQYYLPGFGGGGGMWTIRNLIERLSDRYEFFVFTTDLDGPTRRLPDSVVRDRWTDQGSARVFYATRGFVSPRTLHTLIEEAAPSVVYLNSVFAGLTRKYLSARRRGSVKRIPTLISPCGELSSGALRSKSAKKRSFLTMAKLLGLFNDIVWRATTDMEVPEIKQAVGDGSNIRVAPDLPPREIIPEFAFRDKPPKPPGKVRMIFASRIAPKKNLHFLLEQISRNPLLECELVIAGPIEEQKYWRDCKKKIEQLPSNTKVTIAGGVSNSELLELLVGSHFFVLPTLNENFGYVFLEALAAGCPLIISENTIWSEVAERNAGFVVPLADEKEWQNVLLRAADMGQDDFTKMSLAAREVATEWLARPDHELAMVEALEYVISEDRSLAR